MNAPRKTLATLAVLGSALLLIPVAAQAEEFGIRNFEVGALNPAGGADFQAGSHPELHVKLAMNLDPTEEFSAGGELGAFTFELPAGLVGNPQNMPVCPRTDFDAAAICPPNTQVGIAHVNSSVGNAMVPIYNLAPPLGSPGMLALPVFELISFQNASLRSDGDFGIDISDLTFPEAGLRSVDEEVWGNPWESRYDAVRGETAINGGPPVPFNGPHLPFLTMPTSCGGPPRARMTVSPIGEPENLHSAEALVNEEGGEAPDGLSGCNQLQFEPTIESKPTTNLADSPSGLAFSIHQPQDEDPEGLATAALQDVKVNLPEGMALNPSAGNGLAACSEAAIGYQPSGGQIHFSKTPQSCPDASKLGTLEVSTPLLGEKLGGSIYLAQPYANPFGNLTTIYLAIEDEPTGIVAKLAGKVEADPKTGRLTAIFTENPQLPIEDIETHFFNGPRAALTSPPICGEHTTTTTLTPWSTPEGVDAHPEDTFATSVAPGGGSCPRSFGEAPDTPKFTAGTLSPQAGTYSPFLLKVTREDGTQRLAKINATLPKGLTGKLAGIPYCSEAQIAAAKAREAPNQGAVEITHPSCPAASEVGTVDVGAGSGINPLYVQGHAYLASPYKGAPISIVIITPAVAGPFDLGTVVVRTALNVDPETAEIHAVSDPLPQIIDGIPLDVRSVALSLSRSQFSLNPTSCDPSAVLGQLTSSLGGTASLSSPFQVGGCSSLPFKPKLAISIKGGTKRGGHPALKAIATAKPGEANIDAVSVALPPTEFLDQAHIQTICTKVQFAANQCPARSIYGRARATTPLLDGTLSGPVYLRSSTHKLPDLVVALKGPTSQPIEVVLAGRVDTVHKALRNSFEAVPDAPVSKFILEMQGGKKGLIVNSTNICKSANKAIVKMDGQNGKIHDFEPVLKTSCGGKAKKTHKKR